MLQRIMHKMMTKQDKKCLFKGFSILIINVMFMPYSALAAVVSDTPKAFESSLNLDGLLQVLTALISVIVIIFVLSMLMRKFNMVPGANSGVIKIVSGLALNSKDRLLLVQIGEEQVLLSVSPGNISKLHKMATPVLNQDVQQQSASTKNSFSTLLNSLSKGPKS